MLSNKATVCYLVSSKKQTDTVREQLVNLVEHLAAKETDISLRRWWRPNTELKEREYWTHIHQVTQTRLHMKDHVAAGCGSKQLLALNVSAGICTLIG